jgi:hypothetical protein
MNRTYRATGKEQQLLIEAIHPNGDLLRDFFKTAISLPVNMALNWVRLAFETIEIRVQECIVSFASEAAVWETATARGQVLKLCLEWEVCTVLDLSNIIRAAWQIGAAFSLALFLVNAKQQVLVARLTPHQTIKALPITSESLILIQIEYRPLYTIPPVMGQTQVPFVDLRVLL